MKNALDALPSETSGHITCDYTNTTGRLQVIRIANIPNWYFERVIFPGQQLRFNAFPEALLEVHTSEMATAILLDRIPCTQLRCAAPIPFPTSSELVLLWAFDSSHDRSSVITDLEIKRNATLSILFKSIDAPDS